MTDLVPNAIKIDNLWANYGTFKAVRGISFEVPRGEVFGFIGPNGAGKSTTLKVLATLKAPAFGKVFVDGFSVVGNTHEVRKRIGYMPDSFGKYEDLTSEDYLQFFAAAYQLPLEQREHTIGDALELVGLSDKRSVAVDGLSRGMKQRLSIARVLLHDPSVLLLDEPASGLDPRARIEMRELLKALQEMGKTIIISSHILHELAHLCTRIGIVERGQMVVEGSLDDIYKRLGVHQNIQVHITNLTEGMLAGIKSIRGVVEVDVQDERLDVQVKSEVITPETLLDEMHKAGAKIRLFHPEVMDMEQVFMRITTGFTA
ncbi:MAG: ABC transporter ATP-binding protein [Planctomycetaceae bacterium]